MKVLVRFMIRRIISFFMNLKKQSHQCQCRLSKKDDYNCCVRLKGHEGTHISADGKRFSSAIKNR